MLLSLAACKKEKEPENGEYAVKDEALLGGKPTEGTNRVFYEIFVGSFSDSDGDGVGDIRGIINRMDYLNDGDPDSGRSLGVEGLWLTPIFKSPSYHKYDVTDYFKVDPAFGTEEDLKELIALCHERGVYVILDLPINHTGKMNDWYNQFVIAQRAGDYESQYYNFYTWFDGAQGQPPAGRTFEKIAGTDHYYECNFSGDMPELNFDSSYVRETVFDIAKYYLDLGVDGFRFDAAKYVYFGDHAKSLEFWKEYMGRLREVKPDIYCVAEVWDGDGITDIYYEAVDCFNFTMSQAEGYIGAAAMKGDVNRYTSYVEGYINKISSLREGAVMMPFISNHDMDRAAGYLTVASYAMQMAANIYILGPGSPFIYYGEELGMRGSRAPQTPIPTAGSPCHGATAIR
jgi:glycosidase